MCAGMELGERDSHQTQKWGASEGSVSKVLLGVNRNNRKDVGRQAGCSVRVLRASPTRANLSTGRKRCHSPDERRCEDPLDYSCFAFIGLKLLSIPSNTCRSCS